MYIVSAMFLDTYPVFISEKKSDTGCNFDVVAKLEECTTFSKLEDAERVRSDLDGYFSMHPNLKFSQTRVRKVKIEIEDESVLEGE